MDTVIVRLCALTVCLHFLPVDRRCGLARSPLSFTVPVSLWLDASDSFSAIPFGMIDIVWLGPVFFIPCESSLQFRCRLLLVFVDTVFMRMGALTVSLHFVRSLDSMAWPCLPHPCPFLFCRLAVSSGFSIVLWLDTVSEVCLPVLPCHMLGSSRRCPGCFLLASGACLSSVTFGC